MLRGTSIRYQKEPRPGEQAQSEVPLLPVFDSFPPQMLLPHPGFVIQMQTGMLQLEAKTTDTLHLIQLTEVYWVLRGKRKK